MCGIGTTAHHKQLNIMRTSVIYSYKGSEISFMNGDSVMINATQMAKPFGKRPNDYLSLPSTNQLLNAITRKYGIAENQLVRTERGGLNPGTWMHEDIALDFAQWLSVDFRLWCNDRLKELLKIGVTTVSNDDEAIAYAMSVLQKRLEQAKEQNKILQQQTEIQKQQLQIAAPKVEYYDTVLQSKSTFNTNQIAKELGMSAETLNRKLKNLKVQYKQNGQWLLTSKYQNKGYTKTRTYTYTRVDGTTGTSLQTTWTEAGRQFIHRLFNI